MAFTPKLTYKGRPLVRCGNEIYYGSLSDPYVVFMQVLTTKEENGITVADKLHVILMSTDSTKPLPERVVKQSSKTGLYTALEVGGMWLERALKEAPAAKKKLGKKKAPAQPVRFLFLCFYASATATRYLKICSLFSS